MEDAEDLDELTGGDEEEPTINEDGPSGDTGEREDGEYPGYPGEYEDEPQYPEEGA